METIPAEKPSDFLKPKVEPDDDRLRWVIADSRGILQGLMHVHRNSGYVKDIVVLISKKTPKSYIDYLAERNYDFILAGDDYVDYRLALEALNTRYGVKMVATDSGGLLASVLLESGLVDEVHLLVSPQIVGEKSVSLFRSLKISTQLKLLKVEAIRGSHVLLVYAVTK